MWGFPKQSDSMDSQLLKQNHQLQKLLTDQLKASTERERALVGCLDRVVVSRFDPPVKPQRKEQQPNNSLFPDISDALSVEDDGDFINRMEKLTQ